LIEKKKKDEKRERKGEKGKFLKKSEFIIIFLVILSNL
jgi:hypothetical protein